MNNKTLTTTAAIGVATAALNAVQADELKPEVKAAVDALHQFDWGQSYETIKPIDDAIASSHGNAAVRRLLEQQLIGVLAGNTSRAAKDFACRKLMVIGTAAAVPALAALLNNADLSHMARFALERIEQPEAAQALRDAVAKTTGAVKVGVIGSLGARGDVEAIPLLAAALKDSDSAVAIAAASALGSIGTEQASHALDGAAAAASEDVKLAVANARLACAEKLVAAGKKAQAIAIYRFLNTNDQPKQVRLAATRGLLTAASGN